MRLAGQAKGGYYPTPPVVVELIGRLIGMPRVSRGSEEVVRVLDPCCGGGDALAQLAGELSPDSAYVQTDGVELHRERAEEASAVLHRALWEDLFNTSIANGVYSLLFVNPVYDFSDDEDVRMEQRFLRHCHRYLAPKGTLVFILPRNRLVNSARFLASYFRNLRCLAFPMPEREAFDQVVVFGTQLSRPVLDKDDMEMVRAWSEEDSQLEVLGGPGNYGADYYPPLVASGDTLFATRGVNPMLAAEEARRSGLWAATDVGELLWPGEARPVQPLMPLRKGHMAQLVAAGALNNVPLEDQDGLRVLVKGRAKKKRSLAEQDDDREVYRETVVATLVLLDLDSGKFTQVGAGEPVRSKLVAEDAGDMGAQAAGESCSHCGQPIGAEDEVNRPSGYPGEAYHVRGDCLQAARRREWVAGPPVPAFPDLVPFS